MPDAFSLDRHHREAVEQVHGTIKAFDIRTLEPYELETYGCRRFTAGWRMPIAFADRERRLDLLVGVDFPFEPPAVALVDRPAPLLWPHVEENGLLCLLPNSAAISYHRPGAVAGHLLGSAFRLVEKSITGETQPDFRGEFLSYWQRALKPTGLPFLSLIDLEPPSRILSAWFGSGQVIVGDDKDAVLAWMDNRYGPAEKPRRMAGAGLLWLPEPLHPCEYPSTAADVGRLLDQCTPDARNALRRLAAEEPERIAILLAAPTEYGPCLAGITVPAPRSLIFEGAERRSRLKGFRSGHAPKEIVASRYFSEATPLLRSHAARGDAAWVHGRGQDARHERLAAARVSVVGCGSVGSFVAHLLALAGVGELRLIDPQRLERANGGRHFLGARHVGEHKAVALADELRGNFPHLTIHSHPCSWQELARHEADLLQGCTLVVALTGVWSSNSAMNLWQRAQSSRPAVLYGWTEAYACAGHAVLIEQQGACLECGFDELRRPRWRVTDWPRGTTERQEPACGAVFQPYGPIELMHSVNLVAKTALDTLLGSNSIAAHRVWACPDSFLADCGGEWTPQWSAIAGTGTREGCLARRPWPVRSDCACCGMG